MSQKFADGRLAESPIAPVEVQGYVYDAKLRTAELAREVWRDRELAERLEREAAELRDAVQRGVLGRAARRLLRAGARSGQAARRLALLEHRPPVDERDRPARTGRRRRRRADGRGSVVGLGRAHDVPVGRGLQSARVPQRHGLAARQLVDRAGSRAKRALRRRRSGSSGACSTQASTSSTRCRRSSPGSPGPRRRSRSPTRRRPDHRPGRRARRCCCCSSCWASSPTTAGTRSSRSAPEELPSWVGSLKLSGVRAFGKSWDVRLDGGRVSVEES